MSDSEVGASEMETEVIFDIAETGDVFLVVGPEKHKLRVQSLILKETSKPFAAMLGPNWTKGKEQPSPENPMEILLPEDDPVSLKYICAITHSQTKMIPEELSAQEVLDIAIVIDEYDFSDALALMIRYWLRVCKHSSSKDAAGYLALMTAAYILRDAQFFNENAKALILNYSGSDLALCTQKIEVMMDWRVIYWLEERRDSARLRLTEILFLGFDSQFCGHRCGWTENYALYYMRILRTWGLWPGKIHERGISDSIDILAKTPHIVVKHDNSSCMSATPHQVPDLEKFHCDNLKRFNDDISICLDCVLANNPNPGHCYTAH